MFCVVVRISPFIRWPNLVCHYIYRLIRDGAFPAPIKLGRSSRWLKSEVEAWLQARIAQPRP
ncbi:AlpA family phage regulatory protein [Escherichia coli]|nr:AlpA family phage regulatory protein [Escherichia coli]